MLRILLILILIRIGDMIDGVIVEIELKKLASEESLFGNNTE
jgi:phage-related holin